jgi:hypothetical protein
MPYINGPFNYVQLTGYINNIPKNITIFMDVHLDLNNQTRCESFDSLDISQYLYKLIKEATIELDFFLEIQQTNIHEPKSDRKDIYIRDVIEMFKTEFLLNGDNVKYSKSNSNVRLHYLDIRDILNFKYILKLLKKEIYPQLNSIRNDNLTNSNKLEKLENIKQNVGNIQNYMKNIFEEYINININPPTFNKYTKEYYLNKIIHKYKHKSTKKSVNTFFNDFFTTSIGDFNNLILQINTKLFFYKNDINNQSKLLQLFNLYNNLNDSIFTLYALITDVYFLRRFLDKDYIQNVVTYCGRNHALNYILFLVKYSNFTITKIYNTGGLTLDEITNKIKAVKENDNIDKVYNLFLFEGDEPKQCIDIPDYVKPEHRW